MLEVDIEEVKDEVRCRNGSAGNKKQSTTEQDTSFENERETKLEETKDDDKFRGLQ